MERNAPVWVTALLGVAAIVLVVIGAVYLAEPAHSLPSVFPGHVSAGSKDAGHHHSKHGIAAIGLAVICAFGAWMTTGRRERAGT